MKILFLDIDGVLNHRALFLESDTWQTIGADHVAILDQICGEFLDLRIVVSSTWRNILSIPELEQLLMEHGFTHRSRFIGKTGTRDGLNRGMEIDDWLQENRAIGIESFVIVDDDHDMKPHMNRLVRTTFHLGLCQKHLRDIRLHLNTPWRT